MISRSLKEATERGIIRTVVVPPPGRNAEIEDRLTQRVEVMRPKRVQVVDKVVQVVGGVGSPEVQMQATRLTGRLAEVTNASPVLVPSPGLVGSTTLRQALMADSEVMAVQEQWTNLTVLLVGIGTLEPSPLLRRSGDSLTPLEQEELRQAGAVGTCVSATSTLLGTPSRPRSTNGSSASVVKTSCASPAGSESPVAPTRLEHQLVGQLCRDRQRNDVVAEAFYPHLCR